MPPTLLYVGLSSRAFPDERQEVYVFGIRWLGSPDAREGITLAQRRGGYKGRKGLTPERAAELVQRAGSGVPKAVLARNYGISRETVYQYLRHAKAG